MAQSKRKFYKTTITTVVLSEEPFRYETLADMQEQIYAGDCSGTFTDKSEELSAKEIVNALKEQGSDPEFFQLDKDGNELY